MKIAEKDDLPWPVLRATWRGLFAGLLTGVMLGVAGAQAGWLQNLGLRWWLLVPTVLVVGTTLPDIVVQFVHSVRRFRTAARHSNP